MRCFISINLDNTLKQKIASTVEPLKKTKADVRWVQEENLHLTLKFLGETDEETMHSISKRLHNIAASHISFALSLSGIGLFPDRKRPRVLWLDIKDSDKLIKLQADIEDATSSLGFEKETRRFSPHLTIGRVKSPRGIETLIKIMDTLKDTDFGNIEVKRISLMKSELRPAGSVYTPIAEFNIKTEEG